MANILIIEDNRSTAEQIKQALAGAGHQCLIKPNGDDIIELSRRSTPDVIVLDVMLPGVSGFELCRRLRRDPDLYKVPILILSAMKEEEEVFHGLAQGADDYVVKPFNPNNLLQRVQALLRITDSATGVDSLTSLPNSDGVRREIQRRSSLGATFAVAHCELLNAREFARSYGPEARDRAIRFLARALGKCGGKLPNDEFFLGHMGGGHFIALLSPDNSRTFCGWAQEMWGKHVGQLYRQTNPDGAPPKKSAIDVLFCVTLREAKDTTTPQQVFEILSQIRHKAVAARKAGIHLDRRAAQLDPETAAKRKRVKPIRGMEK